MIGKPWTDEERAALVETYESGGVKASMSVLPGRTETAIHKQAHHMGLRIKPLWKPDEEETLRNLWGVSEVTLRDIATRLGRTVSAVFQHAKLMGLKTGCPDGWEYLAHAAERTGYHVKQLRQILRAADVPIERTLSEPRSSKRSGISATGRLYRPRTCIVCPELVDEAVAKWLDKEPVSAAARRVGVCAETLEKWLRTAGVYRDVRKHRYWRVSSEQVTAAMAMRERHRAMNA